MGDGNDLDGGHEFNFNAETRTNIKNKTRNISAKRRAPHPAIAVFCARFLVGQVNWTYHLVLMCCSSHRENSLPVFGTVI